MDELLVEMVTAIVVAILGYIVGIIKERQYDLKIEDLYVKYKMIFDISGDIIHALDEKLYVEMEEAIAMMKEAYESPTMSTAMFNKIVKESKDVFDRVNVLLKGRKE